ncbi:hypothetical protein evm_013712 [Chilo suppressalis]|nr:hypothetical protein evm_013712 [Chilo suppressalis]
MVVFEFITANPVPEGLGQNIMKRRSCIKAGRDCFFNDYCCDHRRVASYTLHFIPHTCTIFDDFKCRSFLDIPQFGTLLRLHSKLNIFNYQELRSQYWAAVIKNAH